MLRAPAQAAAPHAPLSQGAPCLYRYGSRPAAFSPGSGNRLTTQPPLPGFPEQGGREAHRKARNSAGADRPAHRSLHQGIEHEAFRPRQTWRRRRSGIPLLKARERIAWRRGHRHSPSQPRPSPPLWPMFAAWRSCGKGAEADDKRSRSLGRHIRKPFVPRFVIRAKRGASRDRIKAGAGICYDPG